MQACDEAARRATDDDGRVVARALHGAILTASGRPLEAMRKLLRLHRSHREAILVALYLAEACFLAGRARRAWKVLDGLDEQALADSPWADFAAGLRQTWHQMAELDDLPQPVTVPLVEQSPSSPRS